jgi:predicted transglutaminase-like cysteine proteinase
MIVFACARAGLSGRRLATGLTVAGLIFGGAWTLATGIHLSRDEPAPATTTIPWLLKLYHLAGPRVDGAASAPIGLARSTISHRHPRFDGGAIPSVIQMPAEPFGHPAERAPDGELWTKWRRVEAAIRDEMKIVAQCRANPDDCESTAALRFIALVDNARLFSGLERLGEVNRALNLAIRYTDDLDQHGVVDHWAAPLATLAAARGDCEDYAIAKFVALREAGVSDRDLRIVIVLDTTLDEHHAVLVARLDGRWVVLDNRRNALLDAEELRHFIPLFAINAAGVTQFVHSAPRRPGDAGAKPISSRT